MINRKQFSRMLAEKYGVTYQSAEQICKDIFELLGKVLYEDKEDVTISGFGSFKHKIAKAKKVRHPTTGEIVTTSERDYVKFIGSRTLSEKQE